MDVNLTLSGWCSVPTDMVYSNEMILRKKSGNYWNLKVSLRYIDK